MCGIVGYCGHRQAERVIIDGLRRLEYRGYDSAGVAVLEDNKIKAEKHKGRLANLEGMLNENPIEGGIGIGHTRWATHGEPSDVNSHPHLNNKETIAVVHNGIIENYNELRNWLMEKGYEFKSETDTEVIPNLVDFYYKGDLLDAVMEATKHMEG
ncbi:MAG: class II glutamine amidotransferase, partial [Cutibacterium avidum]|nr:class II glutamine amidotransferase [Cutibacterium avidum]